MNTCDNMTLTGVTQVYCNRNEFQTVLNNFGVDIEVPVRLLKELFHSHFLGTCQV